MQEARKPEINCVSSPFKQMVAAWLNWDGVYVILQRGMKTVVVVS